MAVKYSPSFWVSKVYKHLEFNKVIPLPTHGKTQESSAHMIYIIVFLCWAALCCTWLCSCVKVCITDPAREYLEITKRLQSKAHIPSLQRDCCRDGSEGLVLVCTPGKKKWWILELKTYSKSGRDISPTKESREMGWARAKKQMSCQDWY